jgi:hypothetical protein
MPVSTTDIRNGDVIKTRRRQEAWLIQRGKRRLIPDAETLSSRLSGREMKIVSAARLESYPIGRPLPPVVPFEPIEPAEPTPPSEQSAIRDYLATLPAVPREPASTRILRTAETTKNLQGVPYKLQEQVVRAVTEISEFAYLTPISDVLWPGALVQGKSLVGGDIAPIDLARAPGTITVTTDFAGGTDANVSRQVAKPELPTIQQARTDLLRELNPRASAGAITNYSTVARSLSHGVVKLGLTVNFGALHLDANAKFDESVETNTVMMRFNQAYYAVAFTPSGSPPTFFDESVRLDDVRRLTGLDNPPCYVSSVTYGRTLLVLMTARASRKEIEAALKAKYSSTVEGHIDYSHDELLSQSTIRVLSAGGTGDSLLPVLRDPVKGFEEYVKQGINFSLNSPGAPIAFTARYLSNREIAKASLATEYTETARIWTDPVDADFQVWAGERGQRRVPTFINVAPGDTVTITASGSIWSGVWLTGENGAAGWSSHQAGASFPKPGQPPFSLIAGYGDDWGNWYVAGDFHQEVHEGPPAMLALAINTDNERGGAHHFNVHVRVDRRGQDLPGVGSTAG